LADSSDATPALFGSSDLVSRPKYVVRVSS